MESKFIKEVLHQVCRLSNEELITALKEIQASNQTNNISYKTNKLFLIYSTDDWQLGMDRYSEISRVLEAETIRRIICNEIKLQ